MVARNVVLGCCFFETDPTSTTRFPRARENGAYWMFLLYCVKRLASQIRELTYSKAAIEGPRYAKSELDNCGVEMYLGCVIVRVKTPASKHGSAKTCG